MSFKKRNHKPPKYDLDIFLEAIKDNLKEGSKEQGIVDEVAQEIMNVYKENDDDSTKEYRVKEILKGLLHYFKVEVD